MTVSNDERDSDPLTHLPCVFVLVTPTLSRLGGVGIIRELYSFMYRVPKYK